MSFRYGQFGTGFKRAMPQAAALRFRNLVETRGREVSIVRLTETGADEYGQPVFSETVHTERAFVEERSGERNIPPGAVKEGSLKLFMAPWAAVKEEGHEVEVEGLRYHITGLIETRAYLHVEAERKAE